MDPGYILIVISFLLAVFSSYSFFIGVMAKGKKALKHLQNGERTLYLYTAVIFLSYFLLTYYFLIRDFDVKYVYSYSDTHLSLLYTISAVWAGREGSLLLWAMFVSGLNVILINVEKKDRIAAMSLGISGVVVAFFLFIMLVISNPFERWGVGQPIPEGYGLNPLLRTPEMALHPPTVFLGYAAATIPFAIAVSSAYFGEENWHLRLRKWAVLSWLFLTVGIFLGGWWAYRTLGWGGFWAWDPVENASLLPWLTVTALLHGIMRNRNFRAWNFWLSVVSFALVIIATFITRSGIIESVHAFGENPEGWFYLILILAAVVLSAHVFFRNREFFKEERFRTASREFTIFLNLVILILATATVMLGTLAPAIVENLSVGREYYDRVETPLAMILIVLLGVCIAVGWVYSRERLRRILLISIPAGVVSAILTHFLSGMVYVSAAAGMGIFTLISHFMTFSRSDIQNPRKLGGYIVHVGVVIIAIGIAGSWMHDEVYQNVRIDIGDSITLGSVHFGKITLKLDDLYQKDEHDKIEVIAEISIYRNGNFEGEAMPSTKFYNLQREDRVVGGVAILSKPFLDYYIAMGGFNQNGIFVEFHVIPLISLVWAGSALMMIGGTVSLLVGQREGKS
mgnify:FL=1